MSEIEKRLKNLNRHLADMADSLLYAVQAVKQFKEQMQSFTDLVSCSVDASIDGEPIAARLYLIGTEESEERLCSKS